MNNDRLRLLARIRRQYAVVTERVKFGSVQFEFTRVADPDAVLDEVAAAEDLRERLAGARNDEPLHLPYWAELWDSAWAMAGHVVLNRGEFAGKAVLDLGCGQGLSGAAAAYCGAEVTFADLESPCLLFARLNALGSGGANRARRVNWQTDSLGQTFDRILGADILYERSQWPHLDRFWRAHLRPGGQVWLGEPGRPSGDGFLEFAGPAGWAVHQRNQRIAKREAPVRILVLHLFE